MNDQLTSILTDSALTSLTAMADAMPQWNSASRELLKGLAREIAGNQAMALRAEGVEMVDSMPALESLPSGETVDTETGEIIDTPLSNMDTHL